MTHISPRRTEGVKVGTGSRILPPGCVFSNSFLGAYIRRRSRYLHQIWNFVYVSGMATATDFKFGAYIGYREYYLRMQN